MQGFIDADGYLTLSGRFKEIISRGGEKISPFEVEDVLLGHPSIQDMICFAMPHFPLDEVVGAAIVVRAGMTITLASLRDFAVGKGLNAQWLPEVMVLLPDIPKGTTGKPARIGLAEKMRLPKLSDNILDQCKCWDVADIPGNSKSISAAPAPHLLHDYLLAEQDVMDAQVPLPDPSSSGLSQQSFRSTLQNFLTPAIRLEVAKIVNLSASSVPLGSPLVTIGLGSMKVTGFAKLVQSCTGVTVPPSKLLDMSICQLVDYVISGEGNNAPAPVTASSLMHELKDVEQSVSFDLLPMQRIYFTGRSSMASNNPTDAWLEWETELPNFDKPR